MQKRKWWRVLRWLTVRVVLVAAVLGIYTWCHWSSAGPSYSSGPMSSIELPHRLRNGPEHDAARERNGGNPYILEINPADEGAILYYGASHTNAPDHPQISDIEDRWNEFKPTVALYEGRARGFFYGFLIEPFAGLPEPALVHKLARRNRVRLYSLEPPYEQEVAQLLVQFEPHQVALYFFLRVYISEAGGIANDRLASDLLAKRTTISELRDSLSSLADVDRIWKRDFPETGDWRTLTDEPDERYVPAISHKSRQIRGEHMLRTLVELARQGERVLAVVGSGHVIRQEWNLRALFKMEPAWDQPVLTP